MKGSMLCYSCEHQKFLAESFLAKVKDFSSFYVEEIAHFNFKLINLKLLQLIRTEIYK